MRAQNHRQDDSHVKQSTKQFPRERVFELQMFPHGDLAFPPTHPEVITIHYELLSWGKKWTEGVERKEERRTTLCKVFFIHNRRVKERSLPSVYGPLVDALWQLLLIRAVRLGWFKVVSLRLVPMEGLANQSEVLSQFSSIGIKAAWMLLLQMPEGNGFSPCCMTIF